jgi:hypothetical protein
MVWQTDINGELAQAWQPYQIYAGATGLWD